MIAYQLIRTDVNYHEDQFKVFFGDNRITIEGSWAKDFAVYTEKPLRNYCKKAVYELGHTIENLLGKTNDRIREDLFRYLVLQSNLKTPLQNLTNLIAKAIH